MTTAQVIKTGEAAVAPGPSGGHVLYPNRYAWYILVSALDIMLTVALLVHLGAREVNMIAQRSIELFGTWGLIGLKFFSVVLVVLICEWVGRTRPGQGAKLATAAIFISLIPVTAALTQVALVAATGQLRFQPHPFADESPEFIHPDGVPLYLPGLASPALAPSAPPVVPGDGTIMPE